MLCVLINSAMLFFNIHLIEQILFDMDGYVSYPLRSLAFGDPNRAIRSLIAGKSTLFFITSNALAYGRRIPCRTLIDSTPGVLQAWKTFSSDYNLGDSSSIAHATHGRRLYDTLKEYCGITDEARLLVSRRINFN